MLSTDKARARKAGPYHHGDLRAALIDTAIELIGERGVRNFSMAEASRRLGVAVSAPYAHFADRDALLAAVKVHAYELLAAELPGIRELPDPASRLTALIRAYVRFAATRRPLFEVIYQAGIDKARYPQIEAAERPVTGFFRACVTALSGPTDQTGRNAPAGSQRHGGDSQAPGGHAPASEPWDCRAPASQASASEAADNLATALEATAHGHAVLLLDGEFGDGSQAVATAAERAACAALALVAGRHLLS
jgi:AcrR family transcriptional regulator